MDLSTAGQHYKTFHLHFEVGIIYPFSGMAAPSFH